MKRYDIINHLVKYFGYASYLEIGLQSSSNCFDKIIAPRKVSVDPDINANAMIQATSDEFFSENKKKYDIIFIDGLHEYEQVYYDILHSLDILNDNGTIICHDMLPTNEDMQKVPRETKVWTGDSWKAFARLRYERDDLIMTTVDTDFGCGIIRKSPMPKLKYPFLIDTYSEFVEHKKELMNIISADQFLQTFSYGD